MSENIITDAVSGSDVIIRCSDLEFSYRGSEPILKGITLDIRRGEYVILTGKNGSGKSTFALHLNALLRPTKGKIEICGLDTLSSKNLSKIRRSVGIVFQNPYTQFVGDTVEEDIAFGPENLGLPREEIIQRVNNALEFVGLSEMRRNDPSTLSGGEAQRAAIAGILAMNPECVVFDEVMSMLDTESVIMIRNIIDRLRSEGKTVIFISHDPEEIIRADRVITFDKGIISFSGTPSEYIEKNIGNLPETTKILIMLKEKGYSVNLLQSGNAESVFQQIQPYLTSADSANSGKSCIDLSDKKFSDSRFCDFKSYDSESEDSEKSGIENSGGRICP